MLRVARHSFRPRAAGAGAGVHARGRPGRRTVTGPLLLPALLLMAACREAPPPDAGLLVARTRQWYGLIRTERLSPPVASRLTAHAAVALYAGLAAGGAVPPLAAGTVRGLPLLPVPPAGTVDAGIAAVRAEEQLLSALLAQALPTTVAAVHRAADSLVTARREAGVDGARAARSDSLGRAIGAQLAAWAATDGFAETRGRPYTPPVGPGKWVNDAPVALYATTSLSGASVAVVPDNPANVQRSGNVSDRALILARPKAADAAALPAVNMAGASEPYWGMLRPFVLDGAGSCPLPPPPVYAPGPASPLWGEAQELVRLRRARTAREESTAFYWADNAGESGTPVGHWLSILAQDIEARRLPLPTAARLLVAVTVAQADAFIATWHYKYAFSQLRPRTYIRAHLDPAWEPLIPTPPFPEYPSGHSAVSAAASTVLTAALGAAPFTDSTAVILGHAARRFPSYRDAALEAGWSRLLGGIHFMSGNVGGRTLGDCVGARVVRALQLDELPASPPPVGAR